MTSTPPEIGTLIVVVLKAKNLPNKRHIGKQDPYCTIRHGGETKRTKALKRGGQHPEWDEELRFTIYEDLEDEWAKLTETADSQPPPPPPKDKKKKRKVKGGMKILVTCFADDPREPVYIGETTVDLTEALTKGETDEWFTLTNKEKYCGEVYLELTYWSNEKPPEKKVKRPSSSFNPQYGGPGSFTPSASDGTSLPTNGESPARTESSPNPSLRASSSIASVNLYQPPYERQPRHSDVNQLANRIADLSVGSNPPRENHSSAGPSEFGYADSPSRVNGNYISTLSSAGSISSVHSIHSIASLNPHHRNSLSASPSPSRISSASYQLPPSPHPTGYDVTPVDNYPPSSSGFSYPTTFPEPDIPTPSPISYPPYETTPPPPPVASSGFVLPQPAPPNLDYDYEPSIPQPSFPYQMAPSHTPYPSSLTPQPPQPSHTPFQPLQTPPPPLNSYPIQTYTSSPRPLDGYGVDGAATVPPSRESPTYIAHSQPPPVPVSAFQQLQGVAPQGSRPLPFPQVRPEQTSPSGYSTPAPFIAPGPPPPLPPPPPPPPSLPRHRPSLPSTPSLNPSQSHPPAVPPPHPHSTFNTPSHPQSTFNTPPAPPSQYYNQPSNHYAQPSFSSHHYNHAPDSTPHNESLRQPYAYATPPPPPRTSTLPYQSPPQWQTTPYNSGYVSTPPSHATHGHSSPVPPPPPPPPLASVMPTPSFQGSAPAAAPYGYPSSNQYGW